MPEEASLASEGLAPKLVSFYNDSSQFILFRAKRRKLKLRGEDNFCILDNSSCKCMLVIVRVPKMLVFILFLAGI